MQSQMEFRNININKLWKELKLHEAHTNLCSCDQLHHELLVWQLSHLLDLFFHLWRGSYNDLILMLCTCNMFHFVVGISSLAILLQHLPIIMIFYRCNCKISCINKILLTYLESTLILMNILIIKISTKYYSYTQKFYAYVKPNNYDTVSVITPKVANIVCCVVTCQWWEQRLTVHQELSL